MGDRNELAAKLVNCVLFATCLFAPAIAQDRTADYEIDCKLFRKNANGTWFLGAQTTVEVGPTRFTLAPGEIARGDIRFGMIDLHSVLLSACGNIKAEPSQGKRSAPAP